MSDPKTLENPFRQLDELKNRLPFLWELETARPRLREERAATVEPLYPRIVPEPAA
jgi:hypothetical protein